ncbi:hypothetical protein QBC35DRAFT_471989 [Podospora australis]|uniref:Uncharacterized protein n=1 Tax=Podospora australis TaxID=1536484 RepID=A0AAN7AIR4_9PEZI|nr:hypothetical protein QBC35DRAFT_471989 [Podospora australis]
MVPRASSPGDHTGFGLHPVQAPPMGISLRNSVYPTLIWTITMSHSSTRRLARRRFGSRTGTAQASSSPGSARFNESDVSMAMDLDPFNIWPHQLSSSSQQATSSSQEADLSSQASSSSQQAHSSSQALGYVIPQHRQDVTTSMAQGVTQSMESPVLGNQDMPPPYRTTPHSQTTSPNRPVPPFDFNTLPQDQLTGSNSQNRRSFDELNPYARPTASWPPRPPLQQGLTAAQMGGFNPSTMTSSQQGPNAAQMSRFNRNVMTSSQQALPQPPRAFVPALYVNPFGPNSPSSQLIRSYNEHQIALSKLPPGQAQYFNSFDMRSHLLRRYFCDFCKKRYDWDIGDRQKVRDHLKNEHDVISG